MKCGLVSSLLIVVCYLDSATFASGSLLQTFDDPSPSSSESGDYFGFSVAIDGNLVLIGARNDDTNGNNVGQAHLFDATSGSLLQTFDDPTVTGYDDFGYSVAIDDNLVLIGAQADRNNGFAVGQAHLFDVSSGSLLQTFDDPTVTRSDNFGFSVAIDGNLILIGAQGDGTNGYRVGQAHLFDVSSGSLLQTFDDPTPTRFDLFGNTVAIDGNLVLIGAHGDETNGNNVGQAHLFDVTSGSLLQTFDDPSPSNADLFGSSVAIDGNLVLIGAQGDSTNGSFVGQVHLFDAKSGSLLQTFDDPTVTTQEYFGFSVAIEGNLVLIGAPEDDTNDQNVGQAHLFDATNGTLLHTFDDPTVTGSDLFGSSVAIDGNLVLIGAEGDDTSGRNAGQAYLFDISEFTVPEPGTANLLLGIGWITGAYRRRKV